MSEAGVPRVIAEDEALGQLVSTWGPGTVLGVDTESDAFYAYRERLCLVQVSDGHEIALIDALAVDLSLLRASFEDPAVEIVMHAGENDIRLLQQMGIRTTGLFDTQAATLVLGGDQIGLAGLVENHLGLRLSKREQRSDWRRRPLKDSQLRYAAADVASLHALRELLGARIEEAGRWEDALRLFERIMETRPVEKKIDPEGYYRLKGYPGLDASERAIARALYLAREHRAEKINRPPFMVLGNASLIQIARSKPESESALESVEGIPRASRQRFARGILAAVRLGLDDSAPPPSRRPRAPRSFGSGDGAILDALMAWRQKKAAGLEVLVQVIATARDLELIAHEQPASLAALREIPGIGERWVEDWGPEILKMVRQTPE